MERKGDLSLVELLKLVFAFLIIVGVFVPLGIKIYDFFVPKPDEQTTQNLATLITEAKSLEPGKNIIVPVYIKSGFSVVSFNKDYEALPKKCKAQSCLCLFVIKNEKAAADPSYCELAGELKFEESGTEIMRGVGVSSIDVSNIEGSINIAPKTI